MSYYDITAPAIAAAYLGALDKAYATDFLGKAVYRTPQTDEQVIRSIMLGSTRGLTTWTAGVQRTIDSISPYAIDKTKGVYQNAFGVPRQALKASAAASADVFSAKASGLSNDTVQSMHRYLIAFLVANANDWMGVPLIGSHQYGSYTAQTNELTSTQVAALDVATATTPTVLEAANILIGVAAYAAGYKNEYNVVSTGDAKKFTVLCNTAAIFAAFLNAATLELVQGSGGAVTNPVPALRSQGYEFDIQFTPDLTGTNKVVFLRAEPDQRAVALSEEPEETEYLDSGSEYAKLYDQVMFGVKKVFVFLPGKWTSVLRATMS